MKLPDLIKQAVEEGDWKKVCAVYTAITGKPLSPPKPKKVELDLANFEVTPELLAAILGDDAQQDSVRQAMIDDTGWSYEEDAAAQAEANDLGRPEQVEENQKAPVVSKPIIKDPNDFSVAPRVQRRQDGKQQARKEPMTIPRQRTNKFQDTLVLEAKDLKQNNPKLAAMYGDASRRVLRDETESTGSEVDVECSLCGIQQRVASPLAVGWHPSPDENTYRCNSCNTPSGRRKAERRLRELEGTR